METIPADAQRAKFDVRGSRASSVIVHRVPASKKDAFLAIEDGITRAAQSFPGFQGTDIYPPSDPKASDEWVIVIHFDDEKTLKAWLDSPVRAEWVAKVRNEIGDFSVTTLPGGFGAWFAGLSKEPAGIPPGWKMVIIVVLGLYPTCMLIAIFLGQYLNPKGLAVSMVLGNFVSVACLQWGVMPMLTAAFSSWLNGNGTKHIQRTLAGTALIAALIVAMTFLFQNITG